MTTVHDVHRARAGAPLHLALAAGAALAACGALVSMEPPAPGGPRISGLEVLTAEPRAGCPVLVRVHLDAGEGTQATVGWARLDRRTAGSGRQRAAVELSRTSDVVVSLAPPLRGLYAYQVQVADGAGRWSNVLDTRVEVDPGPADDPSPATEFATEPAHEPRRCA
jgi:hypothetical protein